MMSVGFSWSPVSSTNKTDSHDITEILLKVPLNTIKQTNIKTTCADVCGEDGKHYTCADVCGEDGKHYTCADVCGEDGKHYTCADVCGDSNKQTLRRCIYISCECMI
jgi:hypothetical protein